MIPLVWSDRCLLHVPGGEVFVGMRTSGTEVPERALAIREALADASLVEAREHDDEVLLAVHDASLVDYLRTAWRDWPAGELEQDRVVPYSFAHRGNSPRRIPVAQWARAGWFAYDTMTLIGPGTWEAARAAVDVALTAVDFVTDGAPAAYACTRPPGHHACRDAFGGSCYLNNAAIAAEALRRSLGGTVAVIDIDAHHGNGTQELFWERDDVRTVSVHVDPAAGWFPHFVGFADETTDANRNLPLAPGSGDDEWLAAVREAAAWVEDVAGVVVALGVDAAAADPESPLRVTHEAFREAGRIVCSLGLPTVVVQEGGYDLGTLGPLVREFHIGLGE